MEINNRFSVQGIYGRCIYNFIPNVHNKECITLVEKYLVLQCQHLPLVNFIQQPTKGLILGDGGITKNVAIKMAITCHDCVPLIFMNKNGDGTALIHVSWKNLYLKVLDNVFHIFQQENIDPGNLQVVIGPHISKNNMVYGLESMWLNHTYYEERFFVRSKNGQRESAVDTDTTYFDMASMIKSVIIKQGIKQENILDTKIDTFTNTQYASFRRNGINSSQTNIFTLEVL